MIILYIQAFHLKTRRVYMFIENKLKNYLRPRLGSNPLHPKLAINIRCLWHQIVFLIVLSN